jgi:SAM-dependent methyltransferase
MQDTLNQHRQIWLTKPVLRAVYEDCYRRIAARIVPGGRVLELGGGSGNLKSFLPDIVTSDIQFAPWLDVVADAHGLPFGNASFRNIVLFDVLHHLERPRLFLDEAIRILEPGGRVVLCEPAITPVSYIFYRFFHPESVRLGDDPLIVRPPTLGRDPYESYQAMPTRLFGRDRARLEATLPSLRVIEYGRFSFFAYPLSGGLRPWSLVPASLVRGLLALEQRIETVISPLMAFRLMAVIERQ